MRKKILIQFIIVISFSNIVFAQQDIINSKDHPLITRYPGSYIVFYDEQEYNQYSIATGPVSGYKTISDWIDIEGKFTRIYYELSGNITITQIFSNYLKTMEKSGFKFLAKGINKDRNISKEVGGGSWLGIFYNKNNYPTNSNILLGAGSASVGGTCYIAGKLLNGSKTTYVIIGGKEYSQHKKIYMIDIIEETKMKDDLIFINADNMLNALKTTGKIALYSIIFDFDSANLKSESTSTIKEIASLLKNDINLNLYVVGHSDMNGKLEYNMNLSQQRAVSVVNELIKKYGINANRLSAYGVGPLSPISTNQSDEGRKLNRRVELVAR